MTDIQIQRFVDTIKSSNAKDALLILLTEDRLIIKSNHPDLRKMGYALVKCSKESSSVPGSIELFLQGMNDAIREEDSEQIPLFMPPVPKIQN